MRRSQNIITFYSPYSFESDFRLTAEISRISEEDILEEEFLLILYDDEGEEFKSISFGSFSEACRSAHDEFASLMIHNWSETRS